jgi:peptide methionine sulfoxide reductase MsrB
VSSNARTRMHTHAHARIRTHARTHARARARTHARTHARTRKFLRANDGGLVLTSSAPYHTDLGHDAFGMRKQITTRKQASRMTRYLQPLLRLAYTCTKPKSPRGEGGWRKAAVTGGLYLYSMTGRRTCSGVCGWWWRREARERERKREKERERERERETLSGNNVQCRLERARYVAGVASCILHCKGPSFPSVNKYIAHHGWPACAHTHAYANKRIYTVTHKLILRPRAASHHSFHVHTYRYRSISASTRTRLYQLNQRSFYASRSLSSVLAPEKKNRSLFRTGS